MPIRSVPSLRVARLSVVSAGTLSVPELISEPLPPVLAPVSVVVPSESVVALLRFSVPW